MSHIAASCFILDASGMRLFKETNLCKDSIDSSLLYNLYFEIKQNETERGGRTEKTNKTEKEPELRQNILSKKTSKPFQAKHLLRAGTTGRKLNAASCDT